MTVSRCGVACAGLIVAACRATLLPDELARVALEPPAAAERLHLEVEIESRTLSGVFDGLLVTRAAPPAVRFQLLPDLGTPILDLVATPDAITARMHGEGAARTWRGDDDDPPLAPPLLFGITLLEQHAGPNRARIVTGYAGPPLTLDMRGCFRGTHVDGVEVEDARIVARTFHLGYVAWRTRLRGDHGVVEAPGFRLRARVLSREPADNLGDDLFTLTVDP